MYIHTLNSQNPPVIVVGTGPGGLPIATIIAEAGYPVLLLEKGRDEHKSGFISSSLNFETQASPWTRHSHEWQGNLSLQRGVGVGGSSLYFQGVMHTPEDKIIHSWGVELNSFKKEKALLEQFLKLSGPVQPFHTLNNVSEHLLNSAHQLKWRASPSCAAILSQPLDERPSCIKCGLCVYGCVPGDKSTTYNTWLPRFLKTGRGRILENTEAVSLELTTRDRVSAVNIIERGKQKTLAARAVVLSAGTLETPYILMNSRQHLAKNGVGNHHVGRSLTTSIMYSQLVSCNDIKGDASLGIPIDLLIEEFKSEGVLLYQGRNLAGITGPISAAKFYLNKAGPVGLRAWMRQHYKTLAGLSGMAESSCKFEDGLVSGSGKSFYKSFNVNDSNMLNRIRELIHLWRKQSGAQFLAESKIDQDALLGSMLRGTCRLGSNEKFSAVSALDGRLHGYKNLYVCDSSIIGPGLIADPSLTIQTLGVSFSHKIINHLASL